MVCPVGFLRVGEGTGTLATYEISVFGAIGASSCSRQKEYHEDGGKGPNRAKSKDSGPSGLLLARIRRSIMRKAERAQTLHRARILGSSGARDPRQPMVPSRQGPDLAWDPFPGPSLSPGNLQTRPTGPNRTVRGRSRWLRRRFYGLSRCTGHGRPRGLRQCGKPDPRRAAGQPQGRVESASAHLARSGAGDCQFIPGS